MCDGKTILLAALAIEAERHDTYGMTMSCASSACSLYRRAAAAKAYSVSINEHETVLAVHCVQQATPLLLLHLMLYSGKPSCLCFVHQGSSLYTSCAYAGGSSGPSSALT